MIYELRILGFFKNGKHNEKICTTLEINTEECAISEIAKLVVKAKSLFSNGADKIEIMMVPKQNKKDHSH